MVCGTNVTSISMLPIREQLKCTVGFEYGMGWVLLIIAVFGLIIWLIKLYYGKEAED